MKKINLLSSILLLVISLFTFTNTVKADEIIAKIGETNYYSLDEAIAAASNEDTITLVANATTNGMNLTKDITIEGLINEDGSKYTITFNNKGISLWGKTLTFKNVNIEMNGIGSTLYVEWSWMSIVGSKGAILNLDNSNMTLDGTGTASNVHAIYFCENNQLNLNNNSNLTIKNYPQDAIEWDGEKTNGTGYNVNINNSTYIADHNRSGFTGTFYVTTNNAVVNVINNTGNGSNGSNFVFNNSTVNFNNNGAHGLSAALLTINNTILSANNNKANGIITSDIMTIENNSIVSVTENECSISSKWTIPAAISVGNSTGTSVIKDSTVTITDNSGTGIYQKNINGNLKIEDTAAVTIMRNTAVKLGLGGGLYVNGTVSLGENTVIYNNHAPIAGDDIYNLNTITFNEVKDNWYLDESQDCTDLINGWYDDSEKNNDIKTSGRWNAHASDNQSNHIIKFNAGTISEPFAIKAAHNLKGTVISKYLDFDNNILAEEEITTGYVDGTYETHKKDIDGYTFIAVKGNTTGKFTEETIYVTYYYDKNIGTGDIEELPPQTGYNTNNITVSQQNKVVLYKKED